MAALSKISFKLLGFLKAKTGDSLKILHNYGYFVWLSSAYERCWINY
jgi:hypothetical protein